MLQGAIDGLEEKTADTSEQDAKEKFLEIAGEVSNNKDNYYKTLAYKNIISNLESWNYPDIPDNFKYSDFLTVLYENYLRLVELGETTAMPEDGIYSTTARYYTMTTVPPLSYDKNQNGYRIKSDTPDDFYGAVIDKDVVVTVDGGIIRVTFQYDGEITEQKKYITINKDVFSDLYGSGDYYRSVGDDDSSSCMIALQENGGSFSLEMNFLYPGNVLCAYFSSRDQLYFDIDWNSLTRIGDVAVDKTKLSEALEVAEYLFSTDTTVFVDSTLDAYRAAYENGKAVYEDENVSNAEVRQAVEELNNAREALVTWKNLLKMTLAAAKDVKDDSMSAAGWESLQRAIDEAEAVLNDTKSTPEEYKAQIEKLNAALDADNVVDTTALEAKIAESEAITNDDGKYTEESYANLQQYLTVAKSAVSEGGRTDLTQEIADQLVVLLQSAIDGLEKADNEDGPVDFPDEMPTESFDMTLPDGNYTVPVYMYNAYDDVASMGNGAIEHTATVVKQGQTLTIHVFFHDMPFMDQYGHLEKLWYYTGTNYSLEDRREVTAVRTEILYNEDTNAYVKTLREGSFVAPHSEAVIGCRVQVDAMGDSLQNARLVFDYSKVKQILDIDTSTLEVKIAEAESIKNDDGRYTTDTYTALQNALIEAKNVLKADNLTQDQVDVQVVTLTDAISALVEVKQTDKLSDGVYVVQGIMEKSTKGGELSMSNNAINHNIKLTVKDGQYSLTMNFNGMTIGTQEGYLGSLKYYQTGYTTDQYNRPQGSLADVTVLTYQENNDGTRFSDQFGTDYPNTLSFPMIDEAKEDGYVPLQVFVPVMENISTGSGTQSVYLVLDWATLEKTTDDDERFEDATSEDPGEDPTDEDSTTYTDSTTGVTVVAPAGAFEDEVTLVVKELTSGTEYDIAKNNVFISGKSFKLYEIHFENSAGEEVQPGKSVTVSIPIPSGFNSSKLAAYHFNGTSATVVKGSAANGKYSFTASSFSPYALVDLTQKSNTGLPSSGTGTGNTGLPSSTLSTGSSLSGSSLATSGKVKTGDESNPALWAALIALSALALGGTAFLVKKRKGKTEE